MSDDADRVDQVLDELEPTPASEAAWPVSRRTTLRALATLGLLGSAGSASAQSAGTVRADTAFLSNYGSEATADGYAVTIDDTTFTLGGGDVTLPDGNEISEIVLPDGNTAAQVVAPDGTVVFNVIPEISDAVIAQYDAIAESTTGPITTIDNQLSSSFTLAGDAEVLSSGINDQQTYSIDSGEIMRHTETMATSDPIAIMGVVEQADISTDGYLWDSDEATEFGLRSLDPNRYFLYRGGESRGGVGSPTTNPQLIEMHGINTTEVELYQDGENVDTFGSANSELTGLTISDWGKGNGNYDMPLDFGEIVVLQGFTTSDINSERKRLSLKWGVPG